jgi:hypothetical protein
VGISPTTVDAHLGGTRLDTLEDMQALVPRCSEGRKNMTPCVHGAALVQASLDLKQLVFLAVRRVDGSNDNLVAQEEKVRSVVVGKLPWVETPALADSMQSSFLRSEYVKRCLLSPHTPFELCCTR